MFDRIKADKSQPAMVRDYLLDQAIDQLLAAKRYKDVIAGSDMREKVRERSRSTNSRRSFSRTTKCLPAHS